MSAISDDDIAAFVTATATLLGLPIAAEHRAVVLVNMRTLMTHAAVVTDLPLGLEDASATEFRA